MRVYPPLSDEQIHRWVLLLTGGKTALLSFIEQRFKHPELLLGLGCVVLPWLLYLLYNQQRRKKVIYFAPFKWLQAAKSQRSFWARHQPKFLLALRSMLLLLLISNTATLTIPRTNSSSPAVEEVNASDLTPTAPTILDEPEFTIKSLALKPTYHPLLPLERELKIAFKFSKQLNANANEAEENLENLIHNLLNESFQNATIELGVTTSKQKELKTPLSWQESSLTEINKNLRGAKQQEILSVAGTVIINHLEKHLTHLFLEPGLYSGYVLLKTLEPQRLQSICYFTSYIDNDNPERLLSKFIPPEASPAKSLPKEATLTPELPPAAVNEPLQLLLSLGILGLWSIDIWISRRWRRA